MNESLSTKMKHFCSPGTKSTAINIPSTNKLKNLFFLLLFFSLLFKFFPFISIFLALACSFFSGPNFGALMENLRPRLEAPDDDDEEEEEEEYHDLEVECFVDHEDCQERQDEEIKKRWDENSSSFNGGTVFKIRSFRGQDRADTNYENPQSQQPVISRTLSDLGSARSEKELARKLLQERRNVAGGGEGSVAGGEGMDRLWEVYERTEEEKKGEESKEEGIKKNKSRIVDYLEEVEEEEEEEGEEVNLCCLKALKLSAGKMQFGMGRPGFLSFSRAVRGIRAGWSTHHHHRKKKV